jgi:hypothetical protein
VPTTTEIAQAHQREQKRVSLAAAAAAMTMWQRLDKDALTESWNAGVGQSVVQAVTQAQTVAAAQAAAYLEQLAAAQGVLTEAAKIAPAALAGVASDGRPLASLLYLPIILFKRLLGAGRSRQDAMRQARNFLALIAATQVADAGRGAVHVGMAASREWVTYVRVVNLPACSRCIVLAGRQYSWSTGFQRHPGCDCGMMPFRDGDEPPAMPEELFDRMSAAEQDRRFGKAGADAIRLGADMGQVVNARRGMQTAGGRLVTTEGTTKRGVAGRRMGSTSARRSAVRLMPEQIFEDAAGDRDEAVRLLRRFGYLLSESRPESRPGIDADRVERVQENEAGSVSPDLPAAGSGGSQQPPASAGSAPGWEGPLLGDLIPADTSAMSRRRWDELRDAFRDVIGGTYAGLTVKPSRVDIGDNYAAVEGSILDPTGQMIGLFARLFHREQNGVLWAEHELLTIGEDVQGQGFAQEFNGHLMNWYRASGVERIQLTANVDVGGYAWASYGYDFADEESAQDILDRLEAEAEKLEDWLQQHGDDDSIPASEYQAAETEYEAALNLLERAEVGFGHPSFPTAWEISQVGRVPGQGRDNKWIGKRAMLGSSWHGVKWL